MLNKLKKSNSERLTTSSSKSQKGFTIIEVMIVLAIAGLILLIVFLAVPALQRNARNTQRKNDAAGILGAVSSYIANNNGNPPGNVGTGSGANELKICGTSCTTGNTELAKLGFYRTQPTMDISFAKAPVGFPPETNLVILVGYKCPAAAGTAPTPAERSGRTAVALFALESGSGTTNVCQEQ